MTEPECGSNPKPTVGNLRCVYCDVVGVNLHRDHVVPHSRGGADDAENCVMACPPCNLGKSDKLPSEWKPEGLPEWVYALERRLVHKYRMPARPRRGLKPSGLACFFCGGDIVGEDGTIEIVDQELPPYRSRVYVRFNHHGGRVESGSMTYPGNGKDAVEHGHWSDFTRLVLVSHYGCGPACGYWIPFDRIGEDWEEHVSKTKRWWTYLVDEMVARVREHVGVRKKSRSGNSGIDVAWRRRTDGCATCGANPWIGSGSHLPLGDGEPAGERSVRLRYRCPEGHSWSTIWGRGMLPE